MVTNFPVVKFNGRKTFWIWVCFNMKILEGSTKKLIYKIITDNETWCDYFHSFEGLKFSIIGKRGKRL